MYIFACFVWFMSFFVRASTLLAQPLIPVKLPDEVKLFYSLEDPRFRLFQRIISEEGKKIFVETGTAGGEGVYRAAMAGASEIFTIEYCSDIYQYSKKIFGSYPQIHQYLGDSAKMLESVLPLIEEPCLFWLDAHYNGPRGNDSLGDVNDKCPLLRELAAIGSHSIHSHTILIDDIRCCGTEAFDFLSIEEISEAIYKINPEYVISFEDGTVPGDILMARVPLASSPSVALPKNAFFPTTTLSSSFPYITGETFRHFSDHVFDPISSIDPSAVQPGDTIFVFFDYLKFFFSNIHPRIDSPYVLITHHFFGESDRSIPGPLLAPFLDDPKLIAWFGINIDRIHPKLFALPIGIAPKLYPHGNVDNVTACKTQSSNIPKTSLLYMNFSIHTYPKERQFVYDLFKDQSYCSALLPMQAQQFPKSHSVFLQDLAAHRFCLSPRGNGLDTFRTWEALLMGTYPIVKSSVLNALYEDLPVVIVDEWTQVNQSFLEDQWQKLSQRTFRYEKLYMPYWLDLIGEIRGRPCGEKAVY